LNDKLDRGHINGFTRVAVFVVLLGVASLLASAQSGFSSFSGSIVDEQSRGIPGTAVVLSNEVRQAKYEVKTNAEGRFEFVGLPAGEYGVEVRGIGFQLLKDVLTVPGPSLQRRYMLKLGTLQETITLKFDPNKRSSTDDPEPAPKLREVSMPARKECAASTAGGRVVPPKKIRDVAPQYPRALEGTGIEGTVVMEARIGVDGYVNDIRLIGEPNTELAHATMAAVRDWRYTETLLNCEPVEVMMTVTTNFQRMPPPPPPAPGSAPR
jgi:Carboxypeptidase regulatory-like domain/Gram-negative bacterial TonB protein C-terminal